MFKWIARKTVPKILTYLKYGFVVTEHDVYCCPACGKILNAGPSYQPGHCGRCGQRVTFAGVEWREDREKGYMPIGGGGEFCESIKDRVV